MRFHVVMGQLFQLPTSSVISGLGFHGVGSGPAAAQAVDTRQNVMSGRAIAASVAIAAVPFPDAEPPDFIASSALQQPEGDRGIFKRYAGCYTKLPLLGNCRTSKF